MSGSTFSESWHRVANERVGLLPTVQIHKQAFRGEHWYVLRDAYNNKFFRIRPEAYQFVIRLSPERTVEEVWEECLERYPDTAPGQEEVIRLLAQLHMSNLLYFRSRPDSDRMFARYRKQQQRELRSKLLSFLFLRIPLWNPEAWLRRAEPFIRLVFSRLGLVVWLMVLLLGVKAVVENFDKVTDQAQGLLAPGNLFWLYVALVLLKTIHEFGHAMMCKRFGGEVHTMGVMLLVLTPLPYMDASSSWSFRNRWHRVLVGGAGMITELFVAALAALVWASTGEGTLVHALAFNMMLIGSVSSLVFNGNPLLRFDAYYMLSDWLEIPNLYQRSRNQWYYWVEKYAFGCRDLTPPGRNASESAWLAGYGLASMAYRLLVAVGIVIFVADQWFVLGVIMAMVALVVWLLMPLFKFTAYLVTSQKLDRTRARAVQVSLGTLGVLVLLLAVVPFPDSVRAPGVVQAERFATVYAAVPGYLEELPVASGQWVSQGEVVAVFRNDELEQDLLATRAQIEEAQALQTNARAHAIADIKPIQDRLQALHAKLKTLEERREQLRVRAEVAGLWIAPDLHTRKGSWFKLRTRLGTIVDPGRFQFEAVVVQEKASSLFEGGELRGEVRLWGQAGQGLSLAEIQVIPFQQRELPSPALGWMGGGDIEVDTESTDGRLAKEAFFKVVARLDPEAPPMALFHGATGVLRLELESKPVMVQLAQAVDQLLQKRYRL